jgi:hypothetical protein
MFKIRRKKTGSVQEPSALRALNIQDLFAPDGLQVLFDRLRLGTGHVRVYAVHGLPRRLTVGWLDEILGIGDVDVAVHITPAPDRDVVRQLERRENQVATRLVQEHGMRPSLAILVEELQALRTAVELGNDRLFYTVVLIAVHARTEEDLRRRCDAVEASLARRGAKPLVLILRQVDGLKAALPAGIQPFHDDLEKGLTSGAAACCLPLSVSTGGHAAGVLLGHNIYTRAPVFLDRFAGEHVVANQHAFISGEPGSGKSVTVRTMALLEGYRGTRTAFVDPEGEYVHFVQKMGGQVVHLRPGDFSGLNPLDVEPEVLEDGTKRVNLAEKVADLHGLVVAVFRYQTGQGLDVRETALLEEAVREEYAEREITSDPASLYRGGVKKPMPTLSDVQRRLTGKPGAERLIDGMKPLLAGGSLGMFDGQTTFYLQDAPFICFNLRALGSEFARFVGVYATLAWLWQSFAQRGGRALKKSVAVDEAWMFLRHPGAALYLETLARRGRKHGCALTVATQRFEEFASTKEGRAVIESCATVLVLKQEEHAALAAVNYFKLASGCADLLARARAGQGILRVSGSTTALQVSPAPFEWELVDTRLRGN